MYLNYTQSAMKNFLVALIVIGFSSLAARADFTFVHVSDQHVGSGHEPSNAERDDALYKEISALNPKPAFVVGTGDLCELGTPEQYKAYRKIIPDLTLPSYQAPGNHDVRW